MSAVASNFVPYTLLDPAVQLAPVILTSPHSGRCYDPAFLTASRLDSSAIRRSEDSFVEELFGFGPALGLPLLAANFPRAWCDVNREPWELDPAMFTDILPDYVNVNSPRVAAGLGTVPRIVGTGEVIYAKKLFFADAQLRVFGCWQPFHGALQGLIDSTLAQFGSCLVIDCHSMPSLAGRGHARPDIILGDGHGISCAPAVASFLQTELARLGLNIRRNDPYAGGYITRHYGRPRDGVQAVQIEVARGLYMNERDFTKNGSFVALQRILGQFLEAVVKMSGGLLASGLAQAAE